jgi:hypothetical protein
MRVHFLGAAAARARSVKTRQTQALTTRRRRRVAPHARSQPSGRGAACPRKQPGALRMCANTSAQPRTPQRVGGRIRDDEIQVVRAREVPDDRVRHRSWLVRLQACARQARAPDRRRARAMDAP